MPQSNTHTTPRGQAAVGAPHAPATRPPLDKRRIESHALFDGQVEIEIEHLSQVYRLRQTSLGKLILTK